MMNLMVKEIFLSIQGEGSRAGLPCVMVRLAGCNMRCSWCDTAYAWEGGEAMDIDQIVARVRSLGCGRVEVTGGEPLMQPATRQLIEALVRERFETLLETNGSYDIRGIADLAVRIMDVKCPSSGMSKMMLWSNMQELRATDEVKFVIADRHDYEYARDVIARCNLTGRCEIILSPLDARAPAQLAKWILEDRLDVRLGLQLHKIIWPDGEEGLHQT